MKSEERAAFAVMDGWLMFASNMASLRKVMQEETEQGSNRVADVKWESGMAARQSTAYAWVDLAATSKAAKDVIAVATLVTMVQGRNGGAEQRKVLNTAKTDGISRRLSENKDCRPF